MLPLLTLFGAGGRRFKKKILWPNYISDKIQLLWHFKSQWDLNVPPKKSSTEMFFKVAKTKNYGTPLSGPALDRVKASLEHWQNTIRANFEFFCHILHNLYKVHILHNLHICIFCVEMSYLRSYEILSHLKIVKIFTNAFGQPDHNKNYAY